MASLADSLFACAAAAPIDAASARFAELHRVVVIFVNIALDTKPDLTSMQRVFGESYVRKREVTGRKDCACASSIGALLRQNRAAVMPLRQASFQPVAIHCFQHIPNKDAQ